MRIFCKSQLRQRHFTLIELLAAMSVLVLLMYVLFSMFREADRLWNRTGATGEIYENARILMDVITRDLQGAVARADDIPGSDIQFEQPSGQVLRFVSSTEMPSGGVSSPLYEVGYRLVNNEFQRATRNDSAAANWNIYGARPADLFVGTGVDSGTVIDGVLSLSFSCYNSSYTLQSTPNTGLETGLPSVVGVNFKLLDSKSMLRWQQLDAAGNSVAKALLESQVARNFSKRIFLGNRK